MWEALVLGVPPPTPGRGTIWLHLTVEARPAFLQELRPLRLQGASITIRRGRCDDVLHAGGLYTVERTAYGSGGWTSTLKVSAG